MLTGRRFRVEFTGEQTEYAQRIGAGCPAVWNTGLEQRREYRRRGAWMNYQRQAKELAEAKSEHDWLKEVPGHCLQQTLMDLDKTCRQHGTFGVSDAAARDALGLALKDADADVRAYARRALEPNRPV